MGFIRLIPKIVFISGFYAGLKLILMAGIANVRRACKYTVPFSIVHGCAVIILLC